MNTFVLPELLAPAGDLDRLRVCLLYGADAVYLGGRSGNLRASCEGFSPAELRRGLVEAKAVGARIYYCLNSFPLEKELAGLPAVIEDAASAGAHGFIVADPGVLALARRYAPGVPVHLSTQANTTNSAAVAFWAEQGASRVNLARELNCREMRAIREACPQVELEAFVHGAVCLAISGQCLLSAWLNNRPANQGRCTQPCRFEYRAMDVGPAQDPFMAGSALTVEEYTRPGEALWRVEQGERHSSFWAPHELCLLPWLPWFVRAGIDSLKIEGRMRGPAYIAQVVDAYRHALDRAGADAHGRAVSGGEKGFSASLAVAGRGASTSLAGGRNFSTIPAGGGRRFSMTPAGGGELDPCMAELFYAASRPLSSGFFLPGRRRDFSRELLARPGMARFVPRSGPPDAPDLGHRPLARVLEPAGQAAWRVEVLANWRRSRDVELVLPGLKRPLLVGGSYGLENQRGELANELGSGVRGLLYADVEGVAPGVFIRAAE